MKFIRKALSVSTEDCVIWPFSKNKKGYGEIRYKGRNVLAHRLALMLHTKRDGDGKDAAHGICNNRSCVNPLHLSWKTRAENLADKLRDGTLVRGEDCVYSKLKEDQVIAIRSDVRTQRAIAKDYGVALSTVNTIKSRKSWAHISD